MSWLFGYRNQPQMQDLSQFAQVPGGGGAAGGDAGGGGDSPTTTRLNKTQMDAYRFDSSALERAANAAKDLERSGNNFLLAQQL